MNAVNLFIAQKKLALCSSAVRVKVISKSKTRSIWSEREVRRFHASTFLLAFLGTGEPSKKRAKSNSHFTALVTKYKMGTRSRFRKILLARPTVIKLIHHQFEISSYVTSEADCLQIHVFRNGGEGVDQNRWNTGRILQMNRHACAETTKIWGKDSIRLPCVTTTRSSTIFGQTLYS